MIPKHALELVEYIQLTNKKLSKIESGFLATVSVQARANRLISQKQAKWLNDIYQKCTEVKNDKGIFYA